MSGVVPGGRRHHLSSTMGAFVVNEILERQCSGIWRMWNDGVWENLYRSERAPDDLAGLLELFASMALQTFLPGATISARLGAATVSGRVDEEGILLGLARPGSNPVMIRTAMDRLIVHSQRDSRVERSAAPSARDWQTPREPDASQRVDETRPQNDHARSELLDSTRSAVAPDRMRHERVAIASRAARPPGSGPGARETTSPSRRSARPEEGHDDDFLAFTFEDDESAAPSVSATPSAPVNGSSATDFEFEIVFTDEPPAEPKPPASPRRMAAYESRVSPSRSQRSRAAAASSGRAEGDPSAETSDTESAMPLGPCTWQDVAEHVERLLVDSSQFVGRTVAANYWRQLIDDSDEIRECLRVTHRGVVEVREPARELHDDERETMSTLQSDWVQRCMRVIPDVQSSLDSLGAEPWTTHPRTEGVR